MANAKPNILIVDDHALFRRGLREILSNCPDAPSVDEATSGTEAIKKFSERRYDCIILDVFLPGENGIEVLRRLKARDPYVKCLFVSMYPEEQYGIRALKAGAMGYLTKNASPDVLKDAVRRVCSGHKYIDNILAEKLSEDIQGGGRRPHEKLSNRELQVLVMIGMGKSVSQIAKELRLSVKTISSHRANILHKMGASNTTELIQYALKNTLVY